MRDTYKYQLKDGKQVIHRGITSDLNRREREHQAQYPGSQVRQVGRRTTREAALAWEQDGGRR